MVCIESCSHVPILAVKFYGKQQGVQRIAQAIRGAPVLTVKFYGKQQGAYKIAGGLLLRIRRISIFMSKSSRIITFV
jgi:hypothetical protein